MQATVNRINQGRLRNHIIPKQHSYRFSNDGNLFMFDIERYRVDRRYKGTPMSFNNATVQRGFYTDEYEQELAEKVENDAKHVFDLLIDQAQLAIEDRMKLARYIHVYHYRTHKMKTTIEKHFSPLLAEIAQNSKSRSELLGRECVSAGAQDYDLLAEMAEQWIHSQGVKEEMTQEFLASGLGGSPLRNFEVPGLFASLPWRVLEAKEDQFVLGDSFFEYNAVDQPIFEKYIPLNSQQCLFVSRVSHGPKFEQDWIEYIPVQGQVVRAINSRTISAIARFVVSAQDLSWVPRARRAPTNRLPSIGLPLGRNPRLVGGFISNRCPSCYHALRQEDTRPFLQELKNVVTDGDRQSINIEENYQFICNNGKCGFRTDFDALGSKNYLMSSEARNIADNLVHNYLWDQVNSAISDFPK